MLQPVHSHAAARLPVCLDSEPHRVSERVRTLVLLCLIALCAFALFVQGCA